MGKIIGIPIKIHCSWIFVYLFITFLLGNQFGQFYPAWTVLGRWSLALLIAVLFFASLLAHELSHSVVAVHKGVPVQGITLFFFGGVSHLTHEARRPYIEFLITVVGPISSILLAGGFGVLWLLFRDTNPSLEVAFRLLMIINLMLGIFNMLPGFPLDGGRVLRAVIWGVSGSYWRATQIAAIAGQVIGVLIVMGGASLAIFHFQLFALSGIWMVLIGGFLFLSATATLRQERPRNA